MTPNDQEDQADADHPAGRSWPWNDLTMAGLSVVAFAAGVRLLEGSGVAGAGGAGIAAIVLGCVLAGAWIRDRKGR